MNGYLFSNKRRLRQRKEMDGLRLSSAVPKIQWDSNPTAPMGNLYLYLYVGDFCYAYIESTKFCIYNDTEHYTQILFFMDLQRILLGHSHTTVKISYVKYFQS